MIDFGHQAEITDLALLEFVSQESRSTWESSYGTEINLLALVWSIDLSWGSMVAGTTESFRIIHLAIDLNEGLLQKEFSYKIEFAGEPMKQIDFEMNKRLAFVYHDSTDSANCILLLSELEPQSLVRLYIFSVFE